MPESAQEPLLRGLAAVDALAAIAQIKEKMGGLRFYVRGALADVLLAQIVQAEHEISFRICERCGAAGKLRDGGWRRTFCDICEAATQTSRNDSAQRPL